MTNPTLHNTVAVILAAGVGSRLRPLTDDRPKCLVPFGEHTILARAVRLLHLAGVEKLVVATGYRPEMIRAALANAPLQVTFVHNPDFASTQNVVSFTRALNAVDRGYAVLKLDGDVVFEPPVLAACTATEQTTVLVDRSGPLGAEEMKVLVQRDQGRARICGFGKGLDPAQCYGESIGIEWFPSAVIEPLAAAMNTALANGRTGLYYEDVYNDLLGRVAFWAEEVSPKHWAEIDDLADLARARERFVVR